MKNLLATTAIAGLMAMPALAQSQDNAAADTAPAGQDQLAVYDLNGDGVIDDADLKLADTNSDGVVDSSDEPQMANAGDAEAMPKDENAEGSDMAEAAEPKANADAEGGTDMAAGSDAEATPEGEDGTDMAAGSDASGNTPKADDAEGTDMAAGTDAEANTDAEDSTDMAAGTDAEAAPEGDAAAGTDVADGSDASGMAPEADNADGTDMAAGTDESGMTPEADNADGTDMAAGTDAAAGDQANPQQDEEVAAAKDITGERVYDSNDEWIGEVSEMVVADGKTWAIVDVGGFLGIGEKPVALDLSELNVTTDAETDATKVSVDMTKDELESMPEYDKSKS